jgi:hypothetical protein
MLFMVTTYILDHFWQTNFFQHMANAHVSLLTLSAGQKVPYTSILPWAIFLSLAS